MLGCCHCLCSKEYSAYTRVESCYPNDGRPEPVYARVRELVNWGSHDVDRFSSIHEIIGGRIQQDINSKNDNGVAVGLKILATLLERVRELNLILTTTMTASIVQLIETKRPALLQIASSSTKDLIQHSITHVLLNNSNTVPFQRVVYAYLELLKDENLKETAYQALSDITNQTNSIEALPLDDILKALRPNFPAENGARNVLKSMASVVAPLTLSRMTSALFNFLGAMDVWQDEDFVAALILVFFTEMPENCTPALFRAWLEQLPPKTAEAGHSKVIIEIAVRITEQVTPSRLVSIAQTDALSIVLLFVLKLPQLVYPDKAALTASALAVARFVVAHTPQPDLLKMAHKQIWDWLPTEKRVGDSERERVGLVFKFAATFDDAARAVFSKSMALEALGSIKKYMSEEGTDEVTYQTILEYLKSLYDVFPSSRLEAISALLLPLQDLACSKGDSSLHTFVMAAMSDCTKDGNPVNQSYVQKVIGKRLSADPPEADASLPFAVAAFPQLSERRAGVPAVIKHLFKREKFVLRPEGAGRRPSSVALPSLVLDDIGSEEESVSGDRPPIPSLVLRTAPEEASEQSVAEKPPEKFEEAVEKQAEAAGAIEEFKQNVVALELDWQAPALQ